ncbi:hypothetical protein FOZ62_028023, partial [Perkinsus olseni]
NEHYTIGTDHGDVLQRPGARSHAQLALLALCHHHGCCYCQSCSLHMVILARISVRPGLLCSFSHTVAPFARTQCTGSGRWSCTAEGFR